MSKPKKPPVPAPVDLDEVARKARKQSAAAAKKVIKTLEALRELGPPLSWPTRFKPHLVARKKKAKEEIAVWHGVTFEKDGTDCIVQATNNIACVRIRLGHEGEQAPLMAVVPAKAMKLLAAASSEMASLWFHDLKVAIVVDDEIHEFLCIPPNLPFPTPKFDTKMGGRNLNNVTIDADHLLRIQEALDATSLSFRSVKGAIMLLPDNDEDGNCGFLAPCEES